MFRSLSRFLASASAAHSRAPRPGVCAAACASALRGTATTTTAAAAPPAGTCAEPPARAVVHAKEPVCIKVKKGEKYFWCSCGMTKKSPFCDGSHKEFNKAHGTQFRSVHYTAEEDGEAWFCQCKKTGERPLCDGTHANL